MNKQLEQRLKDKQAFSDLQSKVSKDLSELIRLKHTRGLFVSESFSEMERYMYHKTYVGLQNLPARGTISSRYNYRANGAKYSNITDAINQLDSYKRWTRQYEHKPSIPSLPNIY